MIPKKEQKIILVKFIQTFYFHQNHQLHPMLLPQHCQEHQHRSPLHLLVS